MTHIQTEVAIRFVNTVNIIPEHSSGLVNGEGVGRDEMCVVEDVHSIHRV